MANLRVPPHNEEAEQSVLGAVLIDKDAIAVVSETLSASDFYNTTHGILFEMMLALYEERKPIDILTLTTILKKKKLHEKIGGVSYLSSLVNVVPTAANVEHYAQEIKEAATKRALISAGTKISEMGFTEEEEVKDILNKAEVSIFSISQGHIIRGFIPVKEALAESFDRLDELHKKGAGLRGIKTGFFDLDNLLSGLQKSNLVILAARPGQGKTAMAVN
ncbi:MAG: replicative DNA helicase, partial [Candidatus Levybacteria bacterium]|nr:replicative DNA helicase [Candidatus Levybacteria bacterium]